MRVRDSLCLMALFMMTLGGAFVNAQDQPKKIEHTAAAQTSAASGHEMFMSYCASCHGKNATGDGPAASALKITPADLTMLAKENGGKYPNNKVTSILSGQTDLAAHGNKEIPVWGVVFWSMSGRHAGEVHQTRSQSEPLHRIAASKIAGSATIQVTVQCRFHSAPKSGLSARGQPVSCCLTFCI
jgi:hypothetical protein